MTSPVRRIAATLVAAATLLLSACLVSPGKFTSAIDLRRDGGFSYSYTGEIYLLGLSKLAEMANKAKEPAKWVESPCYKAEDNVDQRPCTEPELERQKAEWEDEQKASAERDKRESEVMRAMLGGIDPSSPQAAEELAERLRKQAGWKKVLYKGDGLFEVEFAISGRLDHDFYFPTMERFPMATAFVVLNKRADGSVRMDAPAFGQPSQGNPIASFGQLAAMGAMFGAEKDGKSKDTPKVPELNGRLVLTTDGTILANNTDDGPTAITSGQKLEWKISPRTTATPTALVRLGS